MNRIKSIIKKANFDYRAFPFSPLYSVWEIDEIIRGELYRNLGLATVAIYFATLWLLSDFRGSLFCLLSVFLTLTNVSGLMHFWGLTIDTVTSTVLIICIGLSVDYAAHVVHSFMQTAPDKKNAKSNGEIATKHPNTGEKRSTLVFMRYCYNMEKSNRMKKSLIAIAPAVLHGGTSTLLAVVLLAFSDVYVFVSFFKIFVLVVVFGLYNGLVLLPVLLANFGPNYKTTKVKASNTVKANQNALLSSNIQETSSHEENIKSPRVTGFQTDLNSSAVSPRATGFHSDLNSTSHTGYHSDLGNDTEYKSDLGTETEEDIHQNP